MSSVSMSYRGQTRGGSIRALDSITVDVPEAQFLALVGPSGCGKSTLLKLAAGLLHPTSGVIRLGGEPVTSPRTDIGFMFQTPVLLPWMSVLDNVMLQARVRRLDQTRYLDRSRELLRGVGLEGYEDRYVFELSGGMQQRVAFCRAILHEPSVLLMDEPFGALDALTREQVGLDLQRMWLAQGGQTVLFVTHSISEAALLADRIAVFSPGPGRILDTLDVPFPRPRTANMVDSRGFGELTKKVRSMITLPNGQAASQTQGSGLAD
jgi:NitT/TauT family transport system ATP-binding protein